MPSEIRLWGLGVDDELSELARAPLNLEARLETWLDRDIGVLDPGLLVIGRQVETDFGGFIDLLCLNSAGDIVIVELKRDKTPREATAQLLDYASWVHELSNERITRIADQYLSAREVDLSGAFRERFGTELPDILNEDHSLLLVGSFIDASSERIMRYLSDVHGLRVNAVTFSYFSDPQRGELVARVFLLEPDVVEQRSVQKGASKRRATPSLADFEQQADDHGCGELYRALFEGLRGSLHPYAMQTAVAFYGKLDGSSRSIVSLLPPKSSASSGVAFQVYLLRLSKYLGRTADEVESQLPADRAPWKYYATADVDFSGFAGFFRDMDEVRRFVSLVQADTTG